MVNIIDVISNRILTLNHSKFSTNNKIKHLITLLFYYTRIHFLKKNIFGGVVNFCPNFENAYCCAVAFNSGCQVG